MNEHLIPWTVPPSGGEELVVAELMVAELMVLREGFESERVRSSSTMGRATWAHARNMVDDRLRGLGVDTTVLARGSG